MDETILPQFPVERWMIDAANHIRRDLKSIMAGPSPTRDLAQIIAYYVPRTATNKGRDQD